MTTAPDSEPRPVEVDSSSEPRGGISPLVKVAVVFTVLGGALSLLLFGSQASDALVYSKLVEEVVTKPGDFKNRELRVEGDLKLGSIQFREDPCEYRFVIGKDDKQMPVRFPQCIVPDTFKDQPGLKVTVEGRLTDDGYFMARKLIPKCPSKYEMNERAKSGQTVPHAMPSSRLPAEG